VDLAIMQLGNYPSWI